MFTPYHMERDVVYAYRIL